jgi:hypothetical protein
MLTLTVVLFRCKTWSLTLKEGHMFQIPENKVLRKITGPTKNEVSNLSYYIMRNSIIYTHHLSH